MNWTQLLSSMDDETFKCIRRAVDKENQLRAEKNALTMPDLNEHEKNLAINGHKAQAVMAYRERLTNNDDLCIGYTGVLEAKIKVDQFLSPPKDFMKAAP